MKSPWKIEPFLGYLANFYYRSSLEPKGSGNPQTRDLPTVPWFLGPSVTLNFLSIIWRLVSSWDLIFSVQPPINTFFRALHLNSSSFFWTGDRFFIFYGNFPLVRQESSMSRFYKRIFPYQETDPSAIIFHLFTNPQLLSNDFQTSPVNDFLLTSYLSLFLVMERSSESWMLVPALGFIFLTFGFLLTIIGLPRLFHFSFFSGNPMVR